MRAAVKAAAVQTAPVAFDLEKSIQKVSEFTAEAAKAGADLVAFPYVHRAAYIFLGNSLHIAVC